MHSTGRSRGIERWIQGGLLVLVALMPFHAFFSVWLGSITHHEAIIQAWKEALLLVLALLGLVLIIREAQVRDRLRTWPVLIACGFALIAAIVTVFSRPPLTATAFGAKTDLEFLVAFVLANIVATPKFIRLVTYLTLTAAALVVSFGLLQVYVLPPDFLVHFGYGPATVMPYEVLDPAIKSLRFPATLGGPNQLGTYLLLPLALATVVGLRRRQPWWLLLTLAGLPVLVHTYSRAAWLGALCGGIVILLGLIPGRIRIAAAAALAAFTTAAAFAVDRVLKHGGNLQYYILHSSAEWDNARGSDFQHLASLRLGLQESLAKPLGHGLGTAGPSVFHTGQGLVIENYYLQLAYETGLAGALVFVLLLATCARELAARASRLDLAAASLAALVGVSVASLFLPAWTDSTTALTVWIAVGAVLGAPPETRRV